MVWWGASALESGRPTKKVCQEDGGTYSLVLSKTPVYPEDSLALFIVLL
jgi:hypothetical protein